MPSNAAPSNAAPGDTTHDVAVVGYGPVGNALAILLAQLGLRVVVLERWPEPYGLPRAVHFDHEAARILQACGLGADLAGISEPADVYEWRNAAGVSLLRLGGDGPGVSGWPRSSMFCQPQLEALLDRRAAALDGIEVRRGVEVTALEDDGAAVTVRARPAVGPTVRARAVVGCDGANSTVRRLIGAPVRDLGFFHDWLIVDVVLRDERTFDPVNLQVCDPARPTTAVSGGPGRRRWEFMRLPGESRDDLDDVAAAWRLLAPWDVTPAGATIERHAVYTFQARWVRRWRSGRVLLAGDAAHQMPPFAGQGLCSGLRDAANLAWKLALVLDGEAPDALLDTYGAERRPHVAAVTALSMELGEVICVPDAAQAALRDAAMTGGGAADRLVEPPPLPGIEGGLCWAGSPGAGTPFVQGSVTADGRRARFDDVVGAGWRLVTSAESVGAGGALAPDLAAWFARIGGRVVAVGDAAADGDVGDPDGTYRAWFARHGAVAALQRPDFHVYGSAADAAEVPRLVAALRAHLRAPDPEADSAADGDGDDAAASLAAGR